MARKKRIEEVQKVVTMKEAGEQFLQDKRLSGLREASLLSYSYKVNKLIDFYGEDMPISAIDKKEWGRYVAHITDTERLSPESINTLIRHGRAFLYWAMDQGIIERYHISTIKVDKKVKEAYTDQELDVLLQEPNDPDFRELLTWAFISFLYGTGVRIGTALDIRIEDLDFQFQRFRLRHTKDRQQTYLPLSTTLSQVLRRYLRHRGGEGSDYLFPNPYGDKPCQREYARYVAEYNRARGVTKTSCHLFRHSFARDCARRGMSALTLRDLMCHKTLSVTQGYIDQYGPRLQDALQDNPLDNRQITVAKGKRKRLTI